MKYMTYGTAIAAMCVGFGRWTGTPVPVQKKGKMQIQRNLWKSREMWNSTETTSGI